MPEDVCGRNFTSVSRVGVPPVPRPQTGLAALRAHVAHCFPRQTHSTGCGNRTAPKDSTIIPSMVMTTAAWPRTGRQWYTTAQRGEIRTSSPANFHVARRRASECK